MRHSAPQTRRRSIRIVVIAVMLCFLPSVSTARVVPTQREAELPQPPCLSTAAADNAPHETTGIGAAVRDIGSSSSVLRCRAGLVAFALSRGAEARLSATAQGARCEQLPVSDETLVVSRLWVCSPYDGLLSARGGTTYGLTFLTPTPLDDVRSNRDLVNHEARHAVQWLRYGATMPLAYARGGSDPCANPFEIDAGLLDGGYQC